MLFWHLLTRGEDYAYGRPSLTEHKLRQVELLAGAQHRRGQRGQRSSYRNLELRNRERQLTAQAEQAYRRFVADWQQSGRATSGPPPARQST